MIWCSLSVGFCVFWNSRPGNGVPFQDHVKLAFYHRNCYGPQNIRGERTKRVKILEIKQHFLSWACWFTEPSIRHGMLKRVFLGCLFWSSNQTRIFELSGSFIAKCNQKLSTEGVGSCASLSHNARAHGNTVRFAARCKPRSRVTETVAHTWSFYWIERWSCASVRKATFPTDVSINSSLAIRNDGTPYFMVHRISCDPYPSKRFKFWILESAIVRRRIAREDWLNEKQPVKNMQCTLLHTSINSSTRPWHRFSWQAQRGLTIFEHTILGGSCSCHLSHCTRRTGSGYHIWTIHHTLPTPSLVHSSGISCSILPTYLLNISSVEIVQFLAKTCFCGERGHFWCHIKNNPKTSCPLRTFLELLRSHLTNHSRNISFRENPKAPKLSEPWFDG